MRKIWKSFSESPEWGWGKALYIVLYLAAGGAVFYIGERHTSANIWWQRFPVILGFTGLVSTSFNDTGRVGRVLRYGIAVFLMCVVRPEHWHTAVVFFIAWFVLDSVVAEFLDQLSKGSASSLSERQREIRQDETVDAVLPYSAADDFGQAFSSRIPIPFILGTLLSLQAFWALFHGANPFGAIGSLTLQYGTQFFIYFVAGWGYHLFGKRTWKQSFKSASRVCFFAFLLLPRGPLMSWNF